MRWERLEIPDVIRFEPTVFEDDRGFFFESFNPTIFENATKIPHNAFVQDNHSCSKQSVLRGLHYQVAPKAQGKLVRVVRGTIFDVAVDIRSESPTFGKWVGCLLSHKNRHQLWIPPGFAHGFLTVTQEAEVLYKTTDVWSKEHERCLLWNDPDLDIRWPVFQEPILSAKDLAGLPFSEVAKSL
jgi:dTDP-4-dehydrorhamnose 3,5-epimerase